MDILRKLCYSREDNSKDENKDRGNWSGRFDYVLAAMGAAIGLGNVWRFPYLCYRNGGGAFLLLFVLLLGTVGLPLMLLQAAIAQYSSAGPTSVWQFAPLFQGVGYAMMLAQFIASVYYNIVLAWAAHFLFASFTSNLPWQHCDNSWNTINCMENSLEVLCTNGSRHDNGTCEEEGGVVALWNRTLFLNVTGIQPASPATEYYTRRVLRMSGGLEEPGPPSWDLVLCLLLVWASIFLCMAKGIKTSGKVVYVTATFPFLLLLIFFIRGLLLPHASSGVHFFLVPDFRRLADARVWQDAAMQVFYTLGISAGVVPTLASYNRFHNNMVRDTLVVCVSDLAASLLAGLVVFSYLGHIAGSQGTHISQVAVSGSGLAFEVYPMAVTKLPLPTLWSLLFFLMLLMLGLDSSFAMLEVKLTGLLDLFPRLRHWKTLIVLALCCVLFLLGFPLCSPSGVYWITLLENYSGGWVLLLLPILSYVALCCVYGPSRLYKDMEVMLGYRPSPVWRVLWVSFTPLTLAFLLVFLLADYSRLRMGAYTFPVWSDVIGWLVTLTSLGPMPVFVVLALWRLPSGTILQRVRLLLRPTKFWGPALLEHRRLVKDVPGFVVDPWTEDPSLPENGVEEKHAPLMEIPNI